MQYQSGLQCQAELFPYKLPDAVNQIIKLSGAQCFQSGFLSGQQFQLCHHSAGSRQGREAPRGKTDALRSRAALGRCSQEGAGAERRCTQHGGSEL